MRNYTKPIGLAAALLLGFGLAQAGEGQWTLLGPWGGRTGHMAFDQTNPNEMWVAHAGPMKSTDGGQTWQARSEGIAWHSGRPQKCGITIAPSNRNIIYGHG